MYDVRVEQGQDPRQAFLEMLNRGGGDRPDAGQAPPPEPAADPDAPEQDAPATEAPPADPHTQEAPPLSYEQQPPAAEEVPAAMAALADGPTEGGELMNLGYDAQLQGTALGLRSVAQRLGVIAEGLKLIPALKNIANDLENLNYTEVAAGVEALIAWAQSEEQALMSELEQRTASRQAPPG